MFSFFDFSSEPKWEPLVIMNYEKQPKSLIGWTRSSASGSRLRTLNVGTRRVSSSLIYTVYVVMLAAVKRHMSNYRRGLSEHSRLF